MDKNLNNMTDINCGNCANFKPIVSSSSDIIKEMQKNVEKVENIDKKSKVAVLLVATNRYIHFLPDIINSAEKYLLNDCEKKYFVFTNHLKLNPLKLDDRLTMVRYSLPANHKITSFDNEQSKLDNILFDENKISKTANIQYCYVNHYKFPYPTLYRFLFFELYFELLSGYDYCLYVDADAKFVDNITSDEILTQRTPVRHCGYVNEIAGFDENQGSTFYIPPHQREVYYGGGFWVFDIGNFINLMLYCNNGLSREFVNNMMPEYHDETMLNKWLTQNKPTKILDSSFHYPEPVPQHQFIFDKWKAKNLEYKPKVLMLSKDHNNLR